MRKGTKFLTAPPPESYFRRAVGVEKPISHVHQGTLMVRPTVGDAHPNVIVLPASADEIHDPQFVNGPKTVLALIQALHFRDKVHLLEEQLRWLVDGDNTDGAIVGETQAIRDRFFGDTDRRRTDAVVRDSYRAALRRLKKQKRRRRLNAKAAVRDLLLSTLTNRGIITDIQEPLPRVLHHNAWSVLRQAERQRESDRMNLQQEREKRQSELLVADDGLPSPTQPTEIQQAVQPFVAACANRSRADESPGT